MKRDFEARVIVVDFKYYSKNINSQTIHNVAKYVNSSKGKFAIVISKTELDESGRREQRIKYLESRQLILHLSASDLREMIYRKMNGDVVEDILEQKYNDLILS